jgi:hypothetical protein
VPGTNLGPSRSLTLRRWSGVVTAVLGTTSIRDGSSIFRILLLFIKHSPWSPLVLPLISGLSTVTSFVLVSYFQ